MQSMLSLKFQSCLKLMETAEYNLGELILAIRSPRNHSEFVLRDVAIDSEFWLLIDSMYCEGHLTSWRFDVPPNKRRCFVEGFLARKVFIYSLKHEWDPDIPVLTIAKDVIIGERDITYPEAAKALHDKTFSNLEESGVQFYPVQLTNLEAISGCYGFAWGFSYQFYRVYHPDKLPRRTCLFKSTNDSLECYNRMLDNLAAHIHYICRNGLDFDVPPQYIGFLIDGEEMLPSKLSLDDIREHLLQTFTREDPISLTLFSEDGTLRAVEYLVDVYNIYPDNENVGIEFHIDISQLKF